MPKVQYQKNINRKIGTPIFSWGILDSDDPSFVTKLEEQQYKHMTGEMIGRRFLLRHRKYKPIRIVEKVINYAIGENPYEIPNVSSVSRQNLDSRNLENEIGNFDDIHLASCMEPSYNFDLKTIINEAYIGCKIRYKDNSLSIEKEKLSNYLFIISCLLFIMLFLLIWRFKPNNSFTKPETLCSHINEMLIFCHKSNL